MNYDPQAVIPYVIEQSPRGERRWTSSGLLKDRIIFLGTPVDDQVVYRHSAAPRERGPGAGH